MRCIGIDVLMEQSVQGQYSITFAGLTGISAAIYLYNEQKYKQCLAVINKEVNRLLKQPETDKYSLSILYHLSAKIQIRHGSEFSVIEPFLRKSIQENPYNIESVKLLILYYTEKKRFDLVADLINFDENFYKKQLWGPIKIFLIFLHQSKSKGLTMAQSLINKITTQPTKYKNCFFRPYFFYAKMKYLCCQFSQFEVFLQKDLQNAQDCGLTLQWLMRIAYILENFQKVRHIYLLKQQKGMLTFDDCIIYAACAFKKGEEQRARVIVDEIQVWSSKYKMLNCSCYACYLGILYYLKEYDRVIEEIQNTQQKEIDLEGQKLQIICILMYCYRKKGQYFQERLIFSSLPQFQQNQMIENTVQTAQQAINLARYCYMYDQLKKGRYYVEIAQQTITYIRKNNIELSNKIASWLQSKDPVKGQLLLIFY